MGILGILFICDAVQGSNLAEDCFIRFFKFLYSTWLYFFQNVVDIGSRYLCEFFWNLLIKGKREFKR